jgi:hypothetical protein
MLVTNTEKYPTKIHWYRKNTTFLLAVFQKVNFSKVVDIKNRNQVIKLSGFPANPHLGRLRPIGPIAAEPMQLPNTCA